MAESLAALGVASNIIQLIAFANDLVSRGTEIYKSADGKLVEHQELETIATHIQKLNRNITWKSRLDENGQPKPLTETEDQLRQLCKGCNDEVTLLLSAMNDLKVKSANRRWKSFRQALSSVWNQEKIQKLSERLGRFRQIIDTVLLQLLREQMSVAEASQNRNAAAMENSVHRIMDQTKIWQEEVLKMMRNNRWHGTKTVNISDFSASVSEATENARAKAIQIGIIEMLQFTEMDDRHKGIAKAYEKTFEWVFTEHTNRSEFNGLESSKFTIQVEADEGASGLYQPLVRDVRWDSFLEWLHNNEPLYWLTGKPGSGKSTLMKFLYNHPRTFSEISVWLGQFPSIRAGFFFWNSGTVMQMSRMGLLQSILYQCLDNRLELVPDLFPRRYKNQLLFGGDPRPLSWIELTQALKALVQHTAVRFIFFIDGLDEFNEEPSELVNFILDLAAAPNIKLCVASRPWVVFEEAFESRPRLRLEDLTRLDIQLFVSGKFEASTRFLELQSFQPEAARSLVEEVSNKASGVFLWVYLVVNSLLEGLRNGDSILELAERLLRLPSDLEQLFKKILDRLDENYFEQASRLFQIVRTCTRPPTALTLSFAESTETLAMVAPFKPLSQEEISYRESNMKRRLNSRCKGLLEISFSHEAGLIVQYLHRTVRDFMATPDIWSYVKSGAPEFDPHAALRGSYMFQIKSMQPKPTWSTLRRLWSLMLSAVSYVKVDEETIRSSIPFLDQLDIAGSMFARASVAPMSNNGEGQWMQQMYAQQNPDSNLWRRFNSDLHWTDSCNLISSNERFGKWKVSGVSSFLAFALVLDLHAYVEFKLKRGAPLPENRAGSSFLCLASQHLNVQAVRLLLAHGADPNKFDRALQQTAWQAASRRIYRCLGSEMNDAAEMMELYLNHGATPWLTIPSITPDGVARDFGIDELIQETLGALDTERTERLLSLLNEARKKWPKARRIIPESEGMGNVFKQNQIKGKGISAKLKRVSIRWKAEPTHIAR